MKRFDRRKLVSAAVLAVAALQVALAGVAFFGRYQTNALVARARDGVAAQRFALEHPSPTATGEAPKSPSRWRLLAAADVARTMQTIQAVGDAAGVVFDSVKAAQSNTEGKQSFQINGRGSPEQICEFLAGIEQDERLVIVESGRILPGGDGEMVFELGFATYDVGGGK